MAEVYQSRYKTNISDWRFVDWGVSVFKKWDSKRQKISTCSPHSPQIFWEDGLILEFTLDSTTQEDSQKL